MYVYIIYKDSSIITSVYNTEHDWLRTSIYWETGAEYNYDYLFSGGYCEHV